MSRLESKLTAGIRQAKAEHGTPAPAQPAAKKAAAPPPQARAPRADEMQSPPLSVYDPWKNLFPQRVWPD